jgi:uncharacterized protein (TIGR02001 family)
MSFGLAPAVSMADVSANFGMVSDYLYRGIYQEDSSASAGIDYENDNGLYIGTWAADVGDGVETDIYFGYGGEIGDFSWGVGYTGYYYTDDFDDTYSEINLGIGYGMFSLDFASGEWDGFGAPEDYTFTSLTFEHPSGPYITYGSFGDEFDGDYFEVGYGFDWQGLDLSIALTSSSDLPVSQDNSDADYILVFGINKSIAFGE